MIFNQAHGKTWKRSLEAKKTSKDVPEKGRKVLHSVASDSVPDLGSSL